MEVVKPQKPPYAEKHYRGQPSANQLELILTFHRQELFERHELCQGDMRKLAADLMAPTASESQVKLREAAWAKRDEVWAEYHRACREYEEALSNAPDDRNAAGDRKRKRAEDANAKLQKAADDAKKAHAFLADMKARHKKDPEGVAAQFKALIDDESTRPAIEAIMKHGMCECAGAHGNLCAWVLMMWMAATRFRLEHGNAAPERLASMNDGEVSSYLVDRLKEIPNLEGDVRAQLEAAASGALRFMDVSWPPRAEFHEATYRRETIEKGLGKGARSWPGKNRDDKLNRRVVEECGISSKAHAQKLSEPTKITMLVEKRRELHLTPLQKISGRIETFKALVAYPMSLDEAARLLKTIVAMAHGDSLLTNRHCAVVDLRVVRRRRREYLEAENKGEIGDLEHFYSGPGNREGDGSAVGKKLTRTLMTKQGLPECLKQVRGRISLIAEGDAKLNVDSLLTTTGVARCYVISGAVKDVENTKEAAAGRIVATCLLEGEVWHVMGTPGHFAMLNPFTINCFMTLAEIFLPTLALGHRQDTSLVPRLKMVKSGDGGVVVGDHGDGPIKANVKSAFPKTIRQMDGVMARAVKVIGENKISNAPAHLLAARVASASLSGALGSLEYRGDDLGTGFGVDVDAFTKLIDSMKDVVDISKAVGPLGHILCSCPTPPPPPPAPAPAPRPTNVNDTDPRNGWADDEWDQFAQQHG